MSNPSWHSWRPEDGKNTLNRRKRVWVVRGSITAIVVLIILLPFSALRLSGVTEVSIPAHSKARTVALILSNAGVIHSQWAFLVAATLLHDADQLQAGTYQFKGSVRLFDVVRTLAGGHSLNSDVTITIPEGLRSDQIAALIQQQAGVDQHAFLSLVNRPSRSLASQFPWIRAIPADQGLEGMLFGDTYRFRAQTAPTIALSRLLQNFEQKILDPFYDAGHTADWYHSLILASILEMEVRTPSDRAMVADIFKKRLAAGIPLQADSTVNYITGSSNPRVTSQDMLIASPFNTYRNRGLPPSPISNPSTSSVEAVLHSIPNPYYYFLTDAHGQVHYARTLEEHQRNREQYLK